MTVPIPAEAGMTLSFDADGTYGVHLCNSISGHYEQRAATVLFDGGFSTLVDCTGLPGEAEESFKEMTRVRTEAGRVVRGVTWRIDGDRLVLINSQIFRAVRV